MRAGERANRGGGAGDCGVRAFGGGVMNNNLLLLPGRAINTQLASARARPRAAISSVTHRHDICFRAWSVRAVTNATFLQILAPLLHVAYRDCFSTVSARRDHHFTTTSPPLRSLVDIPPRASLRLLISLLTPLSRPQRRRTLVGVVGEARSCFGYLSSPTETRVRRV